MTPSILNSSLWVTIAFSDTFSAADRISAGARVWKSAWPIGRERATDQHLCTSADQNRSNVTDLELCEGLVLYWKPVAVPSRDKAVDQDRKRDKAERELKRGAARGELERVYSMSLD